MWNNFWKINTAALVLSNYGVKENVVKDNTELTKAKNKILKQIKDRARALHFYKDVEQFRRLCKKADSKEIVKSISEMLNVNNWNPADRHRYHSFDNRDRFSLVFILLEHSGRIGDKQNFKKALRWLTTNEPLLYAYPDKDFGNALSYFNSKETHLASLLHIMDKTKPEIFKDPEVTGVFKNTIKDFGENSLPSLAIRWNLFSNGVSYKRTDSKSALLAMVERHKDSESKDSLLEKICLKDINLKIRNKDYDGAKEIARKFGPARSYWIYSVVLTEAQGVKDKRKQDILIKDMVRYADTVKSIPDEDKEPISFYSRVRENMLAARIYSFAGQQVKAENKFKNLDAKLSAKNTGHLGLIKELKKCKLESYAIAYKNNNNPEYKQSYELLRDEILSTEIDLGDEGRLLWAAANIAKKDNSITELVYVENKAKVNDSKEEDMLELSAEIALTKADILLEENKLSDAEKNIIFAQKKYAQLKTKPFLLQDRIDVNLITLSFKQKDFTTAQKLLEKKLGLTAGYTPAAFENIRNNSKDPQTADMLLSLAQVLLLNRETKQKIISQREKIRIMTDFLAKNETIFSTEKEKLRYITFKISKQNFDYNFSKEFKEEELKKIADEGNELAGRLSQSNEEYKNNALVGYYQAVSRGYYQVAKDNDERREAFLSEADVFNGKAAKVQGANKTEEVVELSNKIAMHKFANKGFFEKLKFTEATMTMINEVKTNFVAKREKYIDKDGNSEFAENTESSETALQTYSFNLEAGYPFSPNFFMFGRMGFDFVSGNQQITKTGEQFVYYDEFEMMSKDNIQGTERKNIDFQFKALEFGLKPYYKGLFDNKYLNTDIFADISGRYEKLFPGMQDQKALGIDYFSHSFSLGGGTYNKIYPWSDFRDLVYLNLDAEYYQRWQFNQKLPEVKYKASTYDAENDTAIDNNNYSADKKNPSSYFFNTKIGVNYSGSTFFAGLAGGIQSYKEGYYDAMSLENSVITNPYVDAYVGAVLPYDMKVSLGFSRKFGENSGNSYSAELSKGNYFIKGSWFNAGKSEYNYNSIVNNTDGSRGIFSGKGKTTNNIYNINIGFKQKLNWSE